MATTVARDGSAGLKFLQHPVTWRVSRVAMEPQNQCSSLLYTLHPFEPFELAKTSNEVGAVRKGALMWRSMDLNQIRLEARRFHESGHEVLLGDMTEAISSQSSAGEMDDPKYSESWSLRTVRSSAFRVPCLRNGSSWFLRLIREPMAVGQTARRANLSLPLDSHMKANNQFRIQSVVSGFWM